MDSQKLMLIDGNSLLYRAFYALPLLKNSQGLYTNGVYGFLTMFNRVVAEQKPSHIVVAFDMSKQTFRNDVYDAYKANRSAPPDELQGQFAVLREVLSALGIVYVEQAGYEADDIIGTLSRRAEEAEIPTVIVTGDGDSLQLVSPQVNVLMTRKGISDIELYDPEQVKKKWEVEPDKLIEIKGLMGDASDNIPGVPGVGPKTAVKLIKEYESLENLYEHLHEVKGAKLVENLKKNRELAFTSRSLATIVRDVDLDYELDDFRVKEMDRNEITELYRRLEFNSLLAALTKDDKPHAQSTEKIPDLFLINSPDAARAFLASINPGQKISLHIHTDYHHPMWCQLLGIYLAIDDKVHLLEMGPDKQDRLYWIKELLENPLVPKYLHNAKFAEVLLLRFGVKLEGVAGDTLLAAYVDDPAFEGEAVSSAFLKYMNLAVSRDNHDVITARLLDLYENIAARLGPEQASLLSEVEMPLSRVLAAMEFEGIKIEPSTLAVIGRELETGIIRDQNRIYELAGTDFNINSPRQLGQVLFEELGLRVVKKTKTGYATGAEILEELYDEHEIIPYILDYRQLSKLKSTYVDALQGMVHAESGRVHTIFKQAQTATGRLSSVEPNLQNIPIRMEEGRRIRKAFVAREGCYILSADYSQIDLRSLAHISGDETLIDTFLRGVDIHTRTAAEIFGVPMEKVDEELRRRAKAVNFGIIYGISDFGLSRDTGVSRQEARYYIDNYLDSYPGVRRYMEEIVDFGRKNGYVETILKRRRYLPDLNAKNKTVQAFARRMALNTPIQGTSADIIKLAMIKTYQELIRRGLKSRILLQVHDDLVLEVPEKELPEVAGLVKNCMESAYTLKVPLIASIKTGRDWYELREYRNLIQGGLDI